MGVRTKNGKYAITYLYNIPELLEVILPWDKKIRAILPEDGFWFAPLSPDTCEIDPFCRKIGEHRESILRKNLSAWLNRIGLKYHSPHKFRHGHIQYGRAHAKNQADLKTISRNVMHSSTQITDQVYSNLPDDERQKRMNFTINSEEVSQYSEEYKLFLEFQSFKNSH